MNKEKDTIKSVDKVLGEELKDFSDEEVEEVKVLLKQSLIKEPQPLSGFKDIERPTRNHQQVLKKDTSVSAVPKPIRTANTNGDITTVVNRRSVISQGTVMINGYRTQKN